MQISNIWEEFDQCTKRVAKNCWLVFYLYSNLTKLMPSRLPTYLLKYCNYHALAGTRVSS